jgi:hypothetical protein
MTRRNQKTVSLPIDLWEELEEEFESREDYWTNKRVKSTTGLIRYYLREGLLNTKKSNEKDKADFEDLRREVQQLKNIVLMRIEQESKK